MIFIPEKEKCALWNELEDLRFIIYDYDKNTKIMFKWYKHENKYDPFYLEVYAIQVVKNTFDTTYLKSLECNCCEAQPQLRYNDIIKKWYCICPSSMICTKNTDEDELKLWENNILDEEHGYYDNPIKAIFHWNKIIAESIIHQCENILKEDNR